MRLVIVDMQYAHYIRAKSARKNDVAGYRLVFQV